MNEAHTTPWTGSQTWTSESFSSSEEWMIQLSEKEIAECETAVKNSLNSNKEIAELTKDDFAFNHFGDRLQEIQEDILNGKGFCLLRGLPGDKWTDEELVRAYWGIGTWIGDAVTQNAKAHLLGHVIDQRAVISGETRIYQTNKAQPFHSDSCDIGGLLC